MTLIAFFVWTFASVVSSTPIATLKRKLAIVAWLSAPPTLVFIIWAAASGGFLASFMQFILPLLWVQAFTALYIGGIIRSQLFRRKSPDPLSLPLATFTFTTICGTAIYLFIKYGIMPLLFDCRTKQEPYFDHIAFEILKDSSTYLAALCNHLTDHEGYYFGSFLVMVVLFIGVAVPADSNLVRANDWLGLFFRCNYTRARNAVDLYRNQLGERRKLAEEARAREAELQNPDELVEPTPYPVPALIEHSPVEAMCLKLRRSQRLGVMGKRLFALDARIELSPEERSLVQKYNLGETVIYDSISRRRHTEAMIAHADSTRDQPGLFDGPMTQLLGLGKTFFRLTRAGVSATAAALSLRVSVASLMRGVHVECKSMDELLAAEHAILEGARNLKFYLQAAATFDGREDIIEL